MDRQPLPAPGIADAVTRLPIHRQDDAVVRARRTMRTVIVVIIAASTSLMLPGVAAFHVALEISRIDSIYFVVCEENLSILCHESASSNSTPDAPVADAAGIGGP
jgi:hypothetical protein